MMATKWNDERTFMFLSLYKENEHLWNPQHKNYHDEAARIRALEAIAYKMQFKMGVQEVNAKISALKITYFSAFQNVSDNATDLAGIKWFPLMRDIFERRSPASPQPADVEPIGTRNRKRALAKSSPERSQRARGSGTHHDYDWNTVDEIVQGIIEDWASNSAVEASPSSSPTMDTQEFVQPEKRNLRPYKPPRYSPIMTTRRKRAQGRYKKRSRRSSTSVEPETNDNAEEDAEKTPDSADNTEQSSEQHKESEDLPPPLLTKQEVIDLSDDNEMDALSTWKSPAAENDKEMPALVRTSTSSVADKPPESPPEATQKDVDKSDSNKESQENVIEIENSPDLLEDENVEGSQETAVNASPINLQDFEDIAGSITAYVIGKEGVEVLESEQRLTELLQPSNGHFIKVKTLSSMPRTEEATQEADKPEDDSIIESSPSPDLSRYRSILKPIVISSASPSPVKGQRPPSLGDDPMDAFAREVAQHLRNLPMQHAILAQNEIMQVLKTYEANSTLNRTADLVDKAGTNGASSRSYYSPTPSESSVRLLDNSAKRSDHDASNGCKEKSNKEKQLATRTRSTCGSDIDTSTVHNITASISSMLEIINSKQCERPPELTNVNYSFGRTVSLMLEEFETPHQQAKRRRIMSVLCE